jgi:hypothetical protein
MAVDADGSGGVISGSGSGSGGGDGPVVAAGWLLWVRGSGFEDFRVVGIYGLGPRVSDFRLKNFKF